MLETSVIDEFLGASLSRLRTGAATAWPQEHEWAGKDACDAVWSRLDFHGVALLFHGQDDALSNWPEPLVARIGEEARLMALWEATHRAALAQLIDHLDRARIKSILMKGTAIAYSLYTDPAARRRGDSDLLIQPRDIAAARDILEGAGWYRNADPHGLTHQEGWRFDSAGAFVHALDLHWEPSDRAALQRVLKREDIFATCRPLPRLDKAAYCASTQLTIVHEAINQKWHEVRGYWSGDEKIIGARRLIWSVDFDLLARSLTPADWRELIEFCSDRGIGPLVAAALSKAAKDLGTDLPAVFIEELAGQREDPAIAAYCNASDDFEEFWLNLRHAPGWRERVALLSDRGFPPAGHLRAKYPKQAGWPAAFLQARLLIETAARVIRRVFNQ